MPWSKEVAGKSEDRVQGSGGGGDVDLHTICRYSLKDFLKERKRRLKSFGSEQLEGQTAFHQTGKEHKCTGLGDIRSLVFNMLSSGMKLMSPFLELLREPIPVEVGIRPLPSLSISITLRPLST